MAKAKINQAVVQGLPDPIPGSLYPKMMFRPMTAEEKKKHPDTKPKEAFRSKIIPNRAAEEALGEEWVEDLHKIPEVAEAHDYNMGEQSADEPQDEDPSPGDDVLAMSEDELRKYLIEKHGYSEKKLAKKSREQLLSIFSS